MYPEYYPKLQDWTLSSHVGMTRKRLVTESILQKLTVLPEHCFDALRLSLMCSGDMTLIPIKWSINRGWIVPEFETVHTCRY
jgi:hypothetical protein